MPASGRDRYCTRISTALLKKSLFVTEKDWNEKKRSNESLESIAINRLRRRSVCCRNNSSTVNMKFLILLVLLLAGCSTESAKILAIFPFQAPSHNVMYEPIMMGLARAGHSVDVVSHFPPKDPVPGFNHISLKGSLYFRASNYTLEQTQKLQSFSGIVRFISRDEPHNLCNLMRLPQLQDIINTKTKYDVMVTEIFGTNCFLAVAHKLKIPVIGTVSSSLYPWANDPFFNSDNPSYIPSPQSGFKSEMGFMERVQNLYIHTTSKLMFYYYERTVSDPLARKYINDLPPLSDLYFNISLVLVNSHRSINGVRPTNPAVIEVAGVHINESQELPQELEEYLNSAKDGVVYFCMGSMLKSETFALDKLQAIYDSFAELTNYKIIWKGKADEMPEGLPPNVRMVPWLPQYATLRHPKVKAFVTHAGLMGTLEAIHTGVPMIGIPFFADQKTNIAGYVQQGIAVRVNYEDITKASFSSALREVLTNPTYKSNIERVSRLFKDRPLSPIEEAVYWVEYVIRNGGESLKSSALHLYWFQYYMIDIALLLLIILTLVLIVIFIVIRKLLGILTATRRSDIPAKLKTK